MLQGDSNQMLAYYDGSASRNSFSQTAVPPCLHIRSGISKLTLDASLISSAYFISVTHIWNTA